MEKIRSVGVTILGWVFIIESLSVFSNIKALISQDYLLGELKELNSYGANHTILSYTILFKSSPVASFKNLVETGIVASHKSLVEGPLPIIAGISHYGLISAL